MRVARSSLCPAIVVAILGVGSAGAGSLSDVLEPTVDPVQEVLAKPFVDELQRTISRGADFTATATTPGFVYKYNPDLNAFERASTTLGPAFLERAETVGPGRADIGITLLYADFQDKDGDDLDGLEESFLVRTAGAFSGGATAIYDSFDLETFGAYLSGTYGLTEQLDVNVLVPAFYTTLDVRKRTRAEGATTRSATADDDALGLGDVQLRGKLQTPEIGGIPTAVGLAVRFPTGEEEDFQGIGDYTVTPSFIVSKAVARLDYHGSLGFEFNADDMERSRFQYGAGVSWAATDWLTANLDFLGNSQLQDDDISEVVPVARSSFSDVPGDITLKAQEGGKTEVLTSIDRQDVLDLAVGLKFNPFGKGVFFASIIVPLNQDGVRPDFIPAGGFEISF